MNSDVIIKVSNATVRFNKATESYNGLKEYVIRMLKGELMFQEFLALKDINLEIKRGESWGLIGSIGSGKSTFLTLAGGLQTPSKGQIIINGKDYTNLSEKERSKLRFNDIGFVLQASNLVPFLTAKQQLELVDRINKKKRQKLI